MSTVLPEENLPTSDPAPSERLDSWKEIAAYFRRDVRTVRRWEQSLGLPVHRHRQHRGVSVYAYKAEVDAWWKQRDGLAAETLQPSKIHPNPAPFGWVVVALLATLGLLHSDVWRPSASGSAGNSASGLVTPTANPEIAEYPSLSPDAQHWAFSWDSGGRGNLDIYIESFDGGSSDRIRLTRDPAADFNPTWSPDGRSIAFVRQAVPDQFQVMVIPAADALRPGSVAAADALQPGSAIAAGGRERTVATCQAQWDRRAGSYLAWTPDGRGLIVLQRESHGQTAGLQPVPPEQVPARRLVLPLDGSRPPGSDPGSDNEDALSLASCLAEP